MSLIESLSLVRVETASPYLSVYESMKAPGLVIGGRLTPLWITLRPVPNLDDLSCTADSAVNL